MKSQFPSGISALRGQGPDTRSKAWRAASARQPWRQDVGTELTAHPPARTIHAFQMTKGLKTVFLYNILL